MSKSKLTLLTASKKVLESNQSKPELIDSIGSNASSLLNKKDLSKESKAKYSCTLLKFAAFVEAKNKDKNAIIRNRKKGKGGYSWYHIAKASIKTSLIEGSFNAIHKGLSDLKYYKPTPNDEKDILNRKYSIDILNNYFRLIKSHLYMGTLSCQFMEFIFSEAHFKDKGLWAQ